MRKKLISLITALSMLTALLPVFELPALAAGEITEISTLEQLEQLAAEVNAGTNYSGKTITLTADIDMSEKYGAGKESWTPIGTYSSNNDKFAGTFDGGNHTISGLYIDEKTSDSYVGLFGHSGGIIQNLKLTDVSVIVTKQYVGGVCSWNVGTITSCSVSGTVTSTNVNGNVGGIAGDNSGTITDCRSSCNVEGKSHVGGIAGTINNATSNISKCYNTGTVTATGSSASAGGVVGYVYSSTISNCYNTGTVTGGGYAGGIVGNYYQSTVKNCYNTGAVTGTGTYVHGISGVGSPTNSYYLTGTAKSGDSYGGTELSAENFKLDTSFFGWDFNNTWEMSADFGRPVLVSNPERLFEGAGAENDPYLIPDLAALETLRDKVNSGKNYAGEYFKLTADIDMPSTSWTPIATSGVNNKSFRGTFDGNNHTISGLCVNNPDSNYAGLFGHSSGTIQNLNLTNVSVTGNYNYVGGVCGYNGGTGRITSCSVSGTVTSTMVGGDIGGDVGGIVGYNYGIVSSCYNTGTVTAADTSAYAGGVVGEMDAGTVSDCYNTGAVPSGQYTGGVVGDIASGTVTNCYYTDSCGAEGEGIKKTAEQFASGEVAYLLQNGQESQVWGQALSGTKDASPVLTSEDTKKVCKVTFNADSKEYAVKYANKGGKVALPEAPEITDTNYAFAKWATAQDADAFTAETEITGDITLNAYMQEKYGAIDGDKKVTATYGTAATQDLSEFVGYAISTDKAGKFDYSITSAKNSKDTSVKDSEYFSISGDTLTVSDATPAETYTLSITATEKENQSIISLFSIPNADAKPFTFDVLVTVAKADGEASVTMADYKCGEETNVNPVPVSATNGTENVAYKYKFTSAVDETYSDTKPTTAGEYTVKATFAATDTYNEVTATDTFTISHDYGDWTITKDPTMTVEGTAERVCKGNKEHIDSVTLPVLTDTSVWTAGDKVEPTETTDGSQVYTSKYGNVTLVFPATNKFSIRYEDGKAIVTAPTRGTYAVLFAAYDNGMLTSLSVQTVLLEKGETTVAPVNFTADGTVKVMLWDSLSGMKPLCAADSM